MRSHKGFILIIVLLLLAVFSATILNHFQELLPSQQILSYQEAKLRTNHLAYRVLRELVDTPGNVNACKLLLPLNLVLNPNVLSNRLFWQNPQICHDKKRQLDYFTSILTIKPCWQFIATEEADEATESHELNDAHETNESGVMIQLLTVRAYSVTKDVRSVYQGSVALPMISKTHCQIPLIQVSSSLISWREIL